MIVLKVDGTVAKLTSKKKKPKLEELQAAVGGYIELVMLPVPLDVQGDTYVAMYANEEGLIHQLPVNNNASIAAMKMIVGDVVLMDEKDWEEQTSA